MSSRTGKEYVDILLAGGHTVTVNVLAMVEAGYLDDDPETTGETLVAIKKHIEGDNDVLKPDGWPILITGTPIAFGYRTQR